MTNIRLYIWLGLLPVCVIGTTACLSNNTTSNTQCSCLDSGLDTTNDVDTGSNTYVDTDADAGPHPVARFDAGIEFAITDAGVVTPNCETCPKIGNSLENMRCAIDLCDDRVFHGQTYTSPTVPNKTQSTYGAVSRFGAINNDLEPLLNDSYALMATGPAKGTDHSVELTPSAQQTKGSDSFSKDGAPIYDVMEWRIHLKAPKPARGFRIYYIFFSEEYDEYVGSLWNDKFYILLEARSTNNGAPTVINFTECRDPGPSGYSDEICTLEQSEMGLCRKDEGLCYIAINTAMSECCWYPGPPNPCPNGRGTTDISGTGFECATDSTDDTPIEQGGMGAHYGSSTGWLVTEWPIDSGEEFDIVFHIHDTNDAKLDSEVILDSFLFVADPDPGTKQVVQ